MYKKFLLTFILLNGIAACYITLKMGFSSYSLRGIYSEPLLYFFTIIFDVGSSVYYFFLLVHKLHKNRLERKHITVFLTTLLSYSLVLMLLLFSEPYLIFKPICADRYVSPSGHKSITLVVKCYTSCSYNLFSNHFIFNKNLTNQIHTNLRKKFNSRRIRDLCNKYKKATKIEWINDENQIQLKVNDGENTEINTINIFNN